MTQQQKDLEFFKQHQQQIKRDKRHITGWQIVILIAFFGLWELFSRLYWIDPLIFSAPSSVWQLLVEKIQDGSILIHLEITIFETILGFVLGTILGIVFASILWGFPRLSKIFDPYLVILNAMPKVALGPIIIVALGPGYFSIIAMGIIISVVITTIVIYSSFREVDPNYIKVLKSFGATPWQYFKEAVFPATLPAMISALKVNVGLAWVGVIVGEFLVSKEGLGYLIVYGFQVFDFTLVMTSLILIAIVAALMYKAVEAIESRLIKHTE